MPEFVYIVVAALIIFAAMFVVFTPGFEPTGFATKKPLEQLKAQGDPDALNSQIVFFAKDISISAESELLEKINGTVSAGVFSSNKMISIFDTEDRYERGVLEFRTLNQMGVSAYLNGKEIYTGTLEPGITRADFTGGIIFDSNVLEIKPTGWFSGKGQLETRLYGISDPIQKYTFASPNSGNGVLDLVISGSEGNMKITMNDNEIFYGRPKTWISTDISRSILRDTNTIEIRPDPGSTFNISLVEVYFTK